LIGDFNHRFLREFGQTSAVAQPAGLAALEPPRMVQFQARFIW
jgi:hypothetical protein